ncbi:hypothetical protein D9M68_981250 [compost metagenome]
MIAAQPVGQFGAKAVLQRHWCRLQYRHIEAKLAQARRYLQADKACTDKDSVPVLPRRRRQAPCVI